MASAAADALPTVGIVSMGDMGAGIARLLVAHRYPVVTNVSDRSCVALVLPATQRAMLSSLFMFSAA